MRGIANALISKCSLTTLYMVSSDRSSLCYHENFTQQPAKKKFLEFNLLGKEAGWSILYLSSFHFVCCMNLICVGWRGGFIYFVSSNSWTGSTKATISGKPINPKLKKRIGWDGISTQVFAYLIWKYFSAELQNEYHR